jgi:DNA-directed RNA polymerase specialized sigma24 family protein
MVNACLADEPSAWEQLFKICHPPLLTLIKALLGSQAADRNLIEEIAGRVWYSVVVDPRRRLDPFDPQRGCSLVTYLAALARNEIRQHFRAERQRRLREKSASRAESALPSLNLWQTEALLDEFDKTLTPREKEFLEAYLLDSSGNGTCEKFSPTNAWQLRHRVQRKLYCFLEQGQ